MFYLELTIVFYLSFESIQVTYISLLYPMWAVFFNLTQHESYGFRVHSALAYLHILGEVMPSL